MAADSCRGKVNASYSRDSITEAIIAEPEPACHSLLPHLSVNLYCHSCLLSSVSDPSVKHCPSSITECGCRQSSTMLGDTSTAPAPNETEVPAARPRKRKRKTFACTICHRRKLKCDQSLPACNRCVKSGAECSYSEYRISDANDGDHILWRVERTGANTETPSRPVGRSTAVERDFTSPVRSDTFVSAGLSRERSRILSQQTKANEDTERSSDAHASGSDARLPETMLFKGLEFATQYFGATNPISPLLHVWSTAIAF